MARKRRPGGRWFGKLCLYLFAVVGILSTLLAAYQFRKISALYSLVHVLSVTDRVEMLVDVNSGSLQDSDLMAKDIPTRVRGAFSELGIEASVRAR